MAEPATLMTTEEVADYLRTTPGTVHYWRSTGKGPKAIKVGRRLLFRLSDIDAFVSRYESDPALSSSPSKRVAPKTARR